MTDPELKRATAAAAGPLPANSSIISGGGCISKKELFYTLHRRKVNYSSRLLRQFFTDERLSRVGLTFEEYQRTRVFSAEASAVIRDDLQKMKFV